MAEIQKVMGIANASIQKIMGIAVGSIQKVCGITYPAGGGGLPLTGWTYRKSITLSRASGAVTNYQMKLLVGESSGATGEDVDCGGLCLSNFNDLRFTKSDGTTLLDYWIESVSGATPNQLATIWIEFDSIGTGATTFYMYYGNAAAAAQYATSSLAGKATFNFFDHFLDDPPAAADWYHYVDNGSETVSGSIFAVTGHLSYNAWGCKQVFSTGYAYRGLAKVNTETGTEIAIFSIDDRSDDGTYIGAGIDRASIMVTGGSKSWLTGREGPTTVNARTEVMTDYAVVEIQRNASTSVIFTIGDVTKQTITTNVPTDNCGFMVYSKAAANTVSWDWVAVRQFLATEPAWGAWGAQET
jgi:hypothetical protein